MGKRNLVAKKCFSLLHIKPLRWLRRLLCNQIRKNGHFVNRSSQPPCLDTLRDMLARQGDLTCAMEGEVSRELWLWPPPRPAAIGTPTGSHEPRGRGVPRTQPPLSGGGADSSGTISEPEKSRTRMIFGSVARRCTCASLGHRFAPRTASGPFRHYGRVFLWTRPSFMMIARFWAGSSSRRMSATGSPFTTRMSASAPASITPSLPS